MFARRFVEDANPPLAELLTLTLGSGWPDDPESFGRLETLAFESPFRAPSARRAARTASGWARYLREAAGVELDPDSLVDVRLGLFAAQERPLLSALGLVREHLRLAAGGWTPPAPRTVVLARVGEAPGGDDRLFELLQAVAAAINRDERVRKALRVAVLPRCDAAAVRLLVAGADLANEPGTAGSGAAGARALAFAASGAVMLGTRDGTLRELEAAVGADNLFLFGLGPLETHAWREGRVYRPQDVYAIDPLVRLSLDALVGSRYAPVARRLRLGEAGALRPARPLARPRRPRRLRPPPGRGARRVRRPAHVHREGDPDARAHAPLLGGAALVSGFGRDLAHALRALARSPGFAASVVLSLAIGIGANAAVFSVASALLLRPLPYADAERLVILWNRSPGLGIAEDWFSTAQYFDIQAGQRGFEELAIAIGANYNLTGDGAPERVGTIRASANLLPMLGARAAHGRLFGPQDATPGTGGTAVLGHATWLRRFGGDPGVVGRSLVLNGEPYEVIGVLERASTCRAR